MLTVALFGCWVLIVGIFILVLLRFTSRPPTPARDKAVVQAMDHAISVVSFAVGNCSYYETRRWPHEKLRALAEKLLEHRAAAGTLRPAL